MELVSSNRSGRGRADRRRVCTGCGESTFSKDYTRGERICTSCGFVVSAHIADSIES